MPRLSIIVPHRRNDARLEATVLSVLENRPDDCEIIVVHDGTYQDPYSLGDEVVFVEAERGSQPVQLLNAGVMAACSPIVHTLLDGTTITPGWTHEPVEALQSQFGKSGDLAAVSVAIEHRSKSCTYGISASAISKDASLSLGRVHSRAPRKQIAGPQLTSGFYSRKVLLALGGFNESLDLLGADVDFAWALSLLQLDTECALASRVHTNADESALAISLRTEQLASLAVAYGVIGGGVARAAMEFVLGCVGGRPVSALSWCKGLISAPRHSPAVRLANAKAHLAEREELSGLRIYSGETTRRRAA